MTKIRELTLWCVVPIALLWLLHAAASQLPHGVWIDSPYLHLAVLQSLNFDFFLSAGSNLQSVMRRAIPALLGGYLLSILVFSQIFLKSSGIFVRTGVSVLFGGWIVNALDKVLVGGVRDYFDLKIGAFEFISNIPDAAQWMGLLAIIVGILIYDGSKEGAEDSPLSVDPGFQFEFAKPFALITLVFGAVTGAVGYVFLDSIGADLNRSSNTTLFLKTHLVGTVTFCLTIYIWSYVFARRYIAPIRRLFESFDDIAAGKQVNFSLSSGEAFDELEAAIHKLQHNLGRDAGVVANKFTEQSFVPKTALRTLSGNILYLGPQQSQAMWVILYRYAGCPLCALHLESIAPLILRAQSKGIRVVCVFQSRLDDYLKKNTRAAQLIKSWQDIELVEDPDRKVNSYFRSDNSLRYWLSLTAIKWGAKAMFRGYSQGLITGSWGQVPAHFLIQPKGQIFAAYYGKHIADHISQRDVERFIESQ